MRVVRVRTKADLAACDALLAEHGPVWGKPASECGATWALYSRGKPIACISATFAAAVHITNTVVHPTHRGRGLQVPLTRAVMRFAARRKQETRTYTHEANTASMIGLVRSGLYPVGRDDQWVKFSSQSGEP